MTRRNFLAGSSALFFAGCKSFSAFARPNLTFGVVSDIHVTTPESTARFEKALRYFKTRGADAVMVPGDLTDWGLRPCLVYVKETWDRVFAGTSVVPLFCTGNHDYDGWAYDDMTMEMHANGYSEFDQMTRKGRPSLHADWQDIFGEKFDLFRVRNVKGYDFISVEWEAIDAYKDVERFPAWMARNGARFRGTKPFFCFQHAPMKGTTPDGDGWADKGTGFAALKDYPNAIAFTGHSHVPFNDERSIWQGEFTSVAIPSLSYASPGCVTCAENGRKPVTKSMRTVEWRRDLCGGQGYFVSVYDDRLVIERIDIEENGAEAATPWIVPLGPDAPQPYAPATRAASLDVPVFPAGATLRTSTRNARSRDEKWVIVMNCEFPQPILADGTRVLYYEIEAKPLDGSKGVMRRFVSPAFAKSPKYEPASLRFWFDVADLPQDKPYVLEVRAFNSYGKPSAPLVSRPWHGKPGLEKTQKVS